MKFDKTLDKVKDSVLEYIVYMENNHPYFGLLLLIILATLFGILAIATLIFTVNNYTVVLPIVVAMFIGYAAYTIRKFVKREKDE